MERIAFGTSGWRGILCEDFTFANVRTVIRAIAEHVLAAGDGPKGLIVGYDTRFMGKRFALEAAKVLADAGMKAYLCDRDTPTPVISHAILERKTAGAVNFTASHNPYNYNGIKFPLHGEARPCRRPPATSNGAQTNCWSGPAGRGTS